MNEILNANNANWRMERMNLKTIRGIRSHLHLRQVQVFAKFALKIQMANHRLP